MSEDEDYDDRGIFKHGPLGKPMCRWSPYCYGDTKLFADKVRLEALVEELRGRIKNLESENAELHKMFTSGAPPYYRLWQALQKEIAELQKRIKLLEAVKEAAGWYLETNRPPFDVLVYVDKQ